MKIFINVKSFDKKKNFIEKLQYDIEEIPNTSNQLIEIVVRKYAEEYSSIYMPNIDKEVENALIQYKDGLIIFLLNDNKILFNDIINIKDGDTITFIKLVMMHGLGVNYGLGK